MRYRWLDAVWPIPIRVLANRLKARRYSSESFDGFVVDRVRDSHLQARFVERVSYTQKVVDPFGQEAEYERTEYRQIGLEAFSDYPQLLLVDPPRHTHLLATRLSELQGFNLTISPIAVDIMDWSRRFQRSMGLRAYIRSLQITAWQLGSGVSGTLLLRGDHDVKEAMIGVTKGTKFKLEKLQIRLSGAANWTLVLFSSGAVKVDDDAPEEFVPALRQCLRDMRE